MALKSGEGHYDLAPPTKREIGQIIQQPAQAAGLRYEKIAKEGAEVALDEILRDDAISNPEALPLLEFCLGELYKRRNGRLLTHDAYADLGAVEGALAIRAEDEYKSLTSEARNSSAFR
jgi:eukaryotic-like serine/threonine-protein kinase